MICLLLLTFEPRINVSNDPLEEIGGRVVFEIESTSPRGDWKLETSLAGYSGGGYFTWTGPDLFGAPGKDALRWSFHVNRPGRYRLLLRNRHDFEDSTLQNDCFTKMDDGPWLKTFSSTRGAWTWATRHEFEGGPKPPAEYELGPGLHVFQISGRSKGFSLDRVHLSIEPAEDVALPPSPTVVEAMAGLQRNSHSLSLQVLRRLRAGQVADVLRGATPELRTSLEAFKERRAESARALDPLDRLAALDALAKLYKDAALEKEVDALRAEPATQAELKADAQWRRIQEALRKAKPNDPAILAACKRLAEAYPDTAAGRRARTLTK